MTEVVAIHSDLSGFQNLTGLFASRDIQYGQAMLVTTKYYYFFGKTISINLNLSRCSIRLIHIKRVDSYCENLLF